MHLARFPARSLHNRLFPMSNCLQTAAELYLSLPSNPANNGRPAVPNAVQT